MVTHHGCGSKDGESALHVATSAPKIPAAKSSGNLRKPDMRTTGVRSASNSIAYSGARTAWVRRGHKLFTESFTLVAASLMRVRNDLYGAASGLIDMCSIVAKIVHLRRAKPT